MFHTLVQCVLFAAIVYYYRWWRRNRRTVRLLRHIPGPPSFPLIGSSYLFLGGDTSKHLHTLRRLGERYGSLFQIWLGRTPVVVLSNADYVRTVLTSKACLDKAEVYRFLPLRGMFSLPAVEWHPRRRTIQPSFNLSVLQSFIPLFEQKADILLQNLQPMAECGDTFDVYRAIARCTLDMVCATTLGVDMNVQNETNCTYLDVLEELFEIVTVRIVNAWLHISCVYRMSQLYNREKKALAIFCRPTKEVLSRRKRAAVSQLPRDVTTGSNIFIEQLQRLAIVEGLFSADEVEHELNTLIFAGNETSATTVANVLLLVAMHPEVQDKIVQEIRNQFGADVRDIRYDKLQRLTYMELAIKETLRLLPVAMLMGRHTSEEIPLGNGFTIPKGVDLAINAFSMHRDPTYWGSDAYLFQPERFASATHPPFAFIPFSAGARNCIGMRYAWLSMKVMLAKVLIRYEVETDLKLNELNFKLAMTMKITNRHMIRLKVRK